MSRSSVFAAVSLSTSVNGLAHKMGRFTSANNTPFPIFFSHEKESKDSGWKKKKQLKKQLLLLGFNNQTRKMTTPYGGCLGSHEDEERSEMRYVVRIAGTSESSSF